MKIKKNYSLSIIFPAYNEMGNIKQSVVSALKIGKEITDDFEIIIVNDGSKDKTGWIADKLSNKYYQIKVIHQKNQGYGGAVWTGIKNASKNLIFFTDTDLQFDIRELKKFIPYITHYDAVFGYRYSRQDSFNRLFSAYCWKLLNRIFLGIKIKDINCAFKLFRKSVFKKIKIINSKGAVFSSEFIFKMQNKNLKIKELPVKHFPRCKGKATGNKSKVIFRALKELWRVYKNKNKIYE